MIQRELPMDVPRDERPDLDELLTELERAVDEGFLYDMECALSRAAAARDGAEPLRT